MTKILKLSLPLFICFVFSGFLNAQSNPVIDKNVFGVYSDNVGGAVFDTLGAHGVFMAPFADGVIVTASITGRVSSTAAFEGSNYLTAVRRSGVPSWAAWGILFNSVNANTFPEGYRNMSAYHGGVIEFYVRVDDLDYREAVIDDWVKADGEGVDGYEVGIKLVNASGIPTNVNFTLGELEFKYNDFGWQKITIELDHTKGGKYSIFTPVNLSSVSIPFQMSHNSVEPGKRRYPVDIDGIVWKKSAYKSAGRSFAANLKNRSNDVSASTIAWSNPEIGSGWQTSDQYIELYIDNDNFVNNSWYVQIYAENRIGDGYSGNVSTSTTAGLVSEAKDRLIPMRFAVSEHKYSNDENPLMARDVHGNPSWDSAWYFLKDYVSFNGATEVKNGGHLVTIWDSRKGFHWDFDAGAENGGWGALPADRVLKVYFMADFNSAVRGLAYQTDTITVEYKHE